MEILGKTLYFIIGDLFWIIKIQVDLDLRNIQMKQEKISLSIRGDKNPMYGKPSQWRGKKLPDTTKIKMSLSLSGDKNPMYGKHYKHTEETKAKMRLAATGERNPMYGKPSPLTGKNFSEDHRKRLSLARKGRAPWNKGKKGSQVAWNKGLKMKQIT